MSSNQLITQLVIANLFTIITATAAMANAPKQLNITCQSKQIGKIEINLSEANPFGGKEEFYYKMTTKRYDRQSGNYLGSETHKIDVHSNDAIAHLSTNEVVHLFPEQTLYLKVPAYGVNWSSFSNQCYVIAPSFGFDLTLGVATNKIYETHSSVYVRMYQTNPQLSFVMVPGTPFAYPKDVLNGEFCPDTDQWVVADDTLNCVVQNPNH